MGKQKRLVKELEAALAQMEQDWRIEHENAGLMERNMLRNIAEQVSERKRYAMVVDAMTAGMKRLTEERDEAEKNVAELLRNNETADSVIRDLRRELEGLKRECSAHSLNLLDRLAATQRERDAALGHWQNAEDLLIARERELDELQEQHAEMSDARDDLDALNAAQAQQEHASQWGALCFKLGIAQASHIDAVIAAAQAQTAPAELVVVNAVTLQKIDALDIGERLIDDEGMMVGRRRDDYYVFKPGLGTYSTTNYDSTLRLYQELKAKA